MFREAPRFPDGLAYGARGGPLWRTSVVVTRGGQEQRNQAWKHPLRRYEIGHEYRDTPDTEELRRYFRSIAQGQLHTFRFRDFLPGQSTVVQNFLGFGTGASQDLQLRKTYQVGTYTYRRPITKPVAGTVRLFVDDIETEAFTVDTTTGIVTTTQDLDTVLRASCTFDVPVRFETDHLDLRRDGPDSWSWPSIVLREVRLSELETMEDDFEESTGANPPTLDQITTLLEPTLSQGIPRLYWSAPAPGPSPLALYRVVRRPADAPHAPFLVVTTLATTVLDWRENDSSTPENYGFLRQLSEEGWEYGVEAVYEDGEKARSNTMQVNAPIPFVIANAGQFNSSIVFGFLDFGEVPVPSLLNATTDFDTLTPVALLGTQMTGTHMTANIAQFSEGGGFHTFLIRDTPRGRLSLLLSWDISWSDG